MSTRGAALLLHLYWRRLVQQDFILHALSVLKDHRSSRPDKAEKEDHRWNQLKEDNDRPDDEKYPERGSAFLHGDRPSPCGRSEQGEQTDDKPRFE